METLVNGTIIRAWGSTPVQRDQYDRRLIQKAIGYLEAGLPVMMSPEGTRSWKRGMNPARPGAGYLALKTGVPIVPVAVTGTELMFKGGRPAISMRVGEPFSLPDLPLSGPERHASIAQATRTMMNRLASMLPPEYRDVYA